MYIPMTHLSTGESPEDPKYALTYRDIQPTLTMLVKSKN
ncbi:hypothetical protein L21SP2_2630 [Salinispira pacifica]|uniref:Uncharacterized protein n=1 Tax=Salinispira pacifica TaxID=1307761 RepID=V5WJI3_9SPIO|nr:hypothetical protein L21SP2_2630 [Salinispira pacifica]